MARGSDISQDVIAPRELILPTRIVPTPTAPAGSIFISGSRIIYSNGSNLYLLSGSALAG